MLNKVMKKMQQLEDEKNPKAKKTVATEKNTSYPTSGFQRGGGFNAKQNSQKGAERARSIGNRLRKGSGK